MVEVESDPRDLLNRQRWTEEKWKKVNIVTRATNTIAVEPPKLS